MDPAALRRAFDRVSRVGLGNVDRPTARYVQGSNQYLVIALSTALPFEVFFLVAGGGSLGPVAAIQAALIVSWVGCFALNVTGWVRTSAVIELLAPLVAFTAHTWLLSYRAGFLLPMLMTAGVSFVTFSPRMRRWGIALTTASGVAVAWAYLDERVAEPRLDVSAAMVDGLLVANVVLVTVVLGLTSGLNHHYFSRERRRAERQLEAAETQARTDPLTRLTNRLGMAESLAAIPPKAPYALALIDLDRFKEVNDTYGHARGDIVLAQVAHVLEESIGSAGTVSRWGGEEFLVLMPAIRLTAALAALERARNAMGPLVRSELDVVPVTFSAGLAMASPGLSWETTVRVADALLYDAKEAGRNRMRHAQVRGDDSGGDE